MELIEMPSWDNLPTREDIFDAIVRRWHFTSRTETVPLDAAKGRVCAEDVFSKVTMPVVRSSSGDGVAVISERFDSGIPDTSQWVIGTDFDRADTGDDFDDKFDAVIMIEDVDLTVDGQLISVHQGVTVEPGCNIKGAGHTLRQGEPLVKKGQVLHPKILSALVIGGHTAVEVLKKPVVAFIPTGSELIAPGEPLIRGKNYDCNSLLAKLMMEDFGAEVVNYPIVRDDKKELAIAIEKALSDADIVVLNGGSSKGGEDFTSHLLHEKGQNICHGAAMAPGKPICISLVDEKLVVNLPGPFMAAYNGMQWFLNAIISHYLGQSRRENPKVHVTLTGDIRETKEISLLCVVEVSRKKDGSGYWGKPYFIRQLPVSRAVAANAQYMTVIGGNALKAGDEIEVELLCSPEQIPLSEK